jgi:hypothetical protein
VDVAFVAVTEQVPTVERVRLVPESVQPEVAVAKVTSPVPEPPLLVNVRVVPVTTGMVAVDTVRAACAVPNVNVTGSLVAEM